MRLRIHPLFLLLLAALVVFGRGGDTLILMLVLATHELAHLIVAGLLDQSVDVIELLPFGGQMRMPNLSNADPLAELVIAAAGPINNLILAGLALWLGGFLPLDPSRLTVFIDTNLAMGLINLLPAVPLDGGRIYRALASSSLGAERAHANAVEMARVIAAALGATAVLIWLLGSNGLPALVIAVFLWVAASREARAAGIEWTRALERRQDTLLEQRLMVGQGLVVMEDVTIATVLRRMFARRYHTFVVLGSDLARLGELHEGDVVRALFAYGLTVTMGELLREKR